jgi:hypothetical protein
VPPTVVAEACCLIDKYLGPAAEAAFLDSIGTGDNYEGNPHMARMVSGTGCGFWHR